MPSKIIELGKAAYDNDKGVRANRIAILVTLEKDGKLSMIGDVWNRRGTDVLECGQIPDTIRNLFPHDPKVQRICDVWDRWHLNYMRAGSPAQQDYLRDHPVSFAYPDTHYDAARRALTAAGLNPDPAGYRYGSTWLVEELPAEIVAEVEGWMTD